MEKEMTTQEAFEQKGYLTGEFRIFYLKDTLGTEDRYHYHSFHKITIFLGGELTYFVEGNSYRPAPFDLILVKAGTIHKIHVDRSSPYERIVLYLSPDFLSAYSYSGDDLGYCFDKTATEGRYLLRQHADSQPAFGNLIHQLISILSAKEFGADLQKKLTILSLLLELNRAVLRTDIQFLHETGRNEVVSRVISYINHHLAQELCIETLAEHAYVSKYHLMRLFKRETGFTLTAYITDRRLLAAREMLLSGKSATEVCYACGFSTYSTFYRAYKEHFHRTPKEERPRR